MKGETIHQKLNLLYFQYKEFILPCVVIFVCLILFMNIVLPQIKDFFSLQNQLATNKNQLQILQKNFQQITELPDEEMNTDFSLVASALPIDRDPVAILTTISRVASVTNLSLKDYSFEIGKISSLNSASIIQIDLSVDGNIQTIRNFIQHLSYGFPLSDVTAVDIVSSSSATIRVSFFAPPFVNRAVDKNEVLKLLTADDKNTLLQLNAWQNGSPE